MKHYYINLDRREDRNFLFRGAMAAQGVSVNDLIRVPARDIEKYQERKDICNAAIDDGFEEFFTFQKDDGDIGKGHLICSWSIMRAWRMIADSDETAMQWVDDYALSGNISEIERVVATLDDLNIVQLSWHDRPDFFVSNAKKSQIKYDIWREYDISPKCPDFYEGSKGCSDWVIILSPDGAQFLLDYMAMFPFIYTELAIFASSCHVDYKGVYSAVHNDGKSHGTKELFGNGWIIDLSKYTHGDSSDLLSIHEVLN